MDIDTTPAAANAPANRYIAVLCPRDANSPKLLYFLTKANRLPLAPVNLPIGRISIVIKTLYHKGPYVQVSHNTL